MQIAWFEDAACGDVSLVGGKAAGLSRLAANHLVPPGFCLTTRAHDAWLEHIADAGDSAPDRLPHPLREQLDEAYAQLARRCADAQLSVAVRSSALDEDGAEASFAGQHESYLNVVGAEEVAAALLRCWASCSSERAVAYRRRLGREDGPIRLAVVVQQLVPADVSAVVFSADPVAGRRDQVLINAGWGLGESIVGGIVTPDAYWVDKADRKVSERRIADKASMVVPGPGGTHTLPVPRLMRDQPALSDAQCAACAELAIELETEFGHPVDIECAFHEDRLYVLQCRPITRLAAPP